MLKTFKEVLNYSKTQTSKTICVVNAHDDDVIKAVSKANESGIASFLLVGDEEKIRKISSEEDINLSGLEVINELDYNKAIQRSIQFVREGKADILMKGKVQTPDLMRGVLNKEHGLRSSDLLSHVGVFETPHYHKLLFLTDGGINIAPDLDKKVAILNNTFRLTKACGIEKPKVAGVCAIENVNPNMPATIDAALLSVMNLRGQLKNCIFEGPLGLDNAISAEAAKTKGISSKISGDVDVILVPSIEAGNISVKSLTYLAGASWGGIVLGAKCPIVLVSRADSYESKLHSIALSVLMETNL